MTVTKDDFGRWIVTTNSSRIAGPFETSSQAWRWIDRNEGSPINRSEVVSEWIWRKGLDDA